jgi:hypothetical protein
MHTFKFTTGMWNVEARLEDAGDRKRIAMVSARTNEGRSAASRHILVFEHDPGCDEIEEAKTHTERVLNEWH